MKQIYKFVFSQEYPRFFLLKDTCYFQDGSEFGEITVDGILVLKKFEKRFEMRAYPDSWIYLYFGKNNFLYDVAQKIFVDNQIFENYRVGDGSNKYYFRMQNKINPETLLFDVYKSEIIWVKEKYFSFSILNGNILTGFANGTKSLIRYDSGTGDLLWQYDVPSEFDWVSELYINKPDHHKAEIQRLIGVYEGILWLTLNNGRLLGLDVENGNLVYNIHQVNQHGNNLLHPNLGPFWGNYLQLDAEKGVLFGLRNHYYYEIDLKTPSESYFLYDISESCKIWQIEADVAGYEWSWEKNEIYFGQNFSDGNNLGIFDRGKREIIWAIRLQKDNGQVRNFNKIEYADGKVYALDQSQTLHIFERNSPA